MISLDIVKISSNYRRDERKQKVKWQTNLLNVSCLSKSPTQQNTQREKVRTFLYNAQTLKIVFEKQLSHPPFLRTP